MILKLPILDKNNSWDQISDKLLEEFIEVRLELKKLDDGLENRIVSKEETAQELLDLMQVSLGALNKLEQKGLSLEDALDTHYDKLIDRGWQIKSLIKLIKFDEL